MSSRDYLDLVDWRRRIAGLYASARSAQDGRTGWETWRNGRDELFRQHPQSPLPVEERSSFRGLSYFDYDGTLRIMADIVDAGHERHEVPTSTGETMVFERFASARFELLGRKLSLDVYWLDVYGGGVFLPFRDATSGSTTYGAGRYLLDTIKGADLGMSGDFLTLDFNFAYNPSCSYDPRWACPLAPQANHLPIEIEAGERRAHHEIEAF